MKKVAVHAFVASILVMPFMVSAQGVTSPLKDSISNIPSFIAMFLKAMVMLALPVVALFLVIAGFKFVSAQGNPGKLGEAKENFVYVLIGALLILGAWVIATSSNSRSHNRTSVACACKCAGYSSDTYRSRIAHPDAFRRGDWSSHCVCRRHIFLWNIFQYARVYRGQSREIPHVLLLGACGALCDGLDLGDSQHAFADRLQWKSSRYLFWID
jgi:hypothetical protein